MVRGRRTKKRPVLAALLTTTFTAMLPRSIFCRGLSGGRSAAAEDSPKAAVSEALKFFQAFTENPGGQEAVCFVQIRPADPTRFQSTMFALLCLLRPARLPRCLFSPPWKTTTFRLTQDTSQVNRGTFPGTNWVRVELFVELMVTGKNKNIRAFPGA